MVSVLLSYIRIQINYLMAIICTYIKVVSEIMNFISGLCPRDENGFWKLAGLIHVFLSSYVLVSGKKQPHASMYEYCFNLHILFFINTIFASCLELLMCRKVWNITALINNSENE